MHRNIVWLIFLGLLGAYMLYFTGSTLLELHRYNSLNQAVEVKNIRWSIRAFAADALSPQADYQFDYEGKAYNGTTVWSERYLNEWTAAEAIHRMDSKIVWINPSDPTQSTMEKLFPLKSTIYMVFLWALIAYFFLLGKKIYRGQYR